MEFFRVKNDIPFMKYRKFSAAISIITFILAFFFLFQKGLIMVLISPVAPLLKSLIKKRQILMKSGNN
jgi:hypothetical protein